MRINEMNDQEKSVPLAKAMGLELVPHPVYGDKHLFFRVPEEWDHDWELADDFYHPSVMALAWRVLNWAFNGVASDGLEVMSAWNRGVIQSMFYIGVPFSGDPTLLELSPADAQRLWLDKVLELAGLVEVDDV